MIELASFEFAVVQFQDISSWFAMGRTIFGSMACPGIDTYQLHLEENYGFQLTLFMYLMFYHDFDYLPADGNITNGSRLLNSILMS